MQTLETNVAKIEIGNSKQTTTYVATLAERAPHEHTELFAVISLPLLNPAATADCERIATAIINALRRCYKRTPESSTFELALGEINDEISKLTALGQHTWIGKISGVIAVREGHTFFAAATGKANVMLLRGDSFNEITDSNTPKHPLKTFDTFSSGKIKVNDVLIITTAELFNHISIDRAKNILIKNSLELAAQEYVRIIEDTAGPEVAFGTLLLQEREATFEAEAQFETTQYQTKPSPQNLFATLKTKAQATLNKDTALGILESVKGAAGKTKKIDVKKISKNAYELSTAHLANLKNQAQKYRGWHYSSILNFFKNSSPAKKFFIISCCVLAIAIIGNLWLARGRRQNAALDAAFTSAKTQIEKLLSDANSRFLFKDTAATQELLGTAQKQINTIATRTEEQTTLKTELEQQAIALQNKIDKIETVSVKTLATLSTAEHLIVLPDTLSTETNKTISSYTISNNTTSDGSIKTPSDIVTSTYLTNNTAAIFDGQSLSVWNFAQGTSGAPYFLNVPNVSDFTGLTRYATNGRIYTLDSGKGQVISFGINGNQITKAQTALTDPALTKGTALAVDGSIYVLTTDSIRKYTAGKRVVFNFPTLQKPFSGNGKLYASSTAQSIYLLDTNGRIIIMNKSGELQRILQNNDIAGAQDFTVNEATKKIYILRKGSLVEISL